MALLAAAQAHTLNRHTCTGQNIAFQKRKSNIYAHDQNELPHKTSLVSEGLHLFKCWEMNLAAAAGALKTLSDEVPAEHLEHDKVVTFCCRLKQLGRTFAAESERRLKLLPANVAGFVQFGVHVVMI